MDNFEAIAEKARKVFEERTLTREQALALARQITRNSAHTIRAIHRNETEPARELLQNAFSLVEQIKALLVNFQDLYFAVYTQDAIKEFVEASITFALIQNQPLPGPEDLDVEMATYLNGLAEVTGELRRRCLDILRKGYSEEAERLLGSMDEIYLLLVTLDFPDAVTNGLRRQTDLVRGIVERTRGDLTISLRTRNLEQAMEDLARRMGMPEE
jgi:translin